jgi:prolycopene isomerase
VGYDAIIIGAGLSGLTAASLLSKRGMKVPVLEKQFKPGGSCGIFKRDDLVFDQGSAMFFGFGSRGFNAHRFVFDCLEEPVDIIRHDLLYTIVYKGERIRFYPEIDRFISELVRLFPGQEENFRRFYADMLRTYRHVLVDTPEYSTPDETDRKSALQAMKKHPVSYFRFISYLFKNTKTLLKKYFDDPAVFQFFDKLTSTYCYTTVEETPAILSAIMFVDNHEGGSYYTAGSTLFLPGKMEKAIEEHGGDMLYEREAVKILFEGGRAVGVLLEDGKELRAPHIITSGTVWNLLGRLIGEKDSTRKQRAWAQAMVPTFSSMVFYACVDASVIPEGTTPVEMLVGNPGQIDESEVTAYIFSIDDRTLCPPDCHVIVAIGPSFGDWPAGTSPYHDDAYDKAKQAEMERVTAVMERRFPGFSKGLRFAELATPSTIERYTLKNKGCVAGPKQMLGQHMFKRLHIRTPWKGLYACGESTILGTGTPAVTVSGVSAANAVLRDAGLQPFVWEKDRPPMVTLVDKPFTRDRMYRDMDAKARQAAELSMECQFCDVPACMEGCRLDIRGVLRRAAVGNVAGAMKLMAAAGDGDDLARAEEKCIRKGFAPSPVQIRQVIALLKGIGGLESPDRS